MDPIAAHLGSSFAFVWVLRILKDAAWFPWITANTKRLNAWVSTITAFFLSLGINADHSGYTFINGGHLVIAIPGAYAIVQALAHFATQRGLQLGMYHGFSMVEMFSNISPDQFKAMMSALSEKPKDA